MVVSVHVRWRHTLRALAIVLTLSFLLSPGPASAMVPRGTFTQRAESVAPIPTTQDSGVLLLLVDADGRVLSYICRNDPVNSVDPLGLAPMLTGARMQLMISNTRFDPETGEWITLDPPERTIPRFGGPKARRILRLIDKLNALTDAQGRHYYRVTIKDLMLVGQEQIKRDLADNALNTLFVAHGGLGNDQAPGNDKTYIWGKGDTTKEYLYPDPSDSSSRIALTDLPGIAGENIFGCYLSPHVRRVTRRWVPEGKWFPRTFVVSEPDNYPPMFEAIYARLYQYADKLPNRAPARPIRIVIYEGERGQGERRVPTAEALRYPLLPEAEYPTFFYQTASPSEE